jgi:hypothetical protein
MTARVRVASSLPYIALHTKSLDSFALHQAGDTAQLAFFKLLMLAGRRGGTGTVPRDPEQLQFVVRLSGGVAAMSEAVDALIVAGLLEDYDDDTLHIVQWARYQAAPSAQVRTSARVGQAQGQHRRYHNAGRHTTAPNADCDLCAAGSGAVSPCEPVKAPAGLPVPATAPQAQGGDAGRADKTPTTPTKDAEAGTGLASQATDDADDDNDAPVVSPDVAPVVEGPTVEDLRKRLWDATTSTVEEAAVTPGWTTRAAYELMHEKAEAATTKYAGRVKGVGPATLLNVVVSHAAQQLVPEGQELTRGTVQLLHRFRRDAGIGAVLDAIEQSMGKQQPAVYVLTVIRSKTAALTAAA